MNRYIAGAWQSCKDRMLNNIVTLVFLVLCAFGLLIARQPASYITGELATRLFRNLILILSLLIPVWAGMGLNFSIVLGAMAAQAGIIVMMNFRLTGIVGLLLCLAVSLALSVLLGIMTGRLFNTTKGQEMITGMILGFFAKGVYELFFMYVCGPLIPISNPDIMLPSGVGVVGTITLDDGFKGIFDNMWKVTLDQALGVCAIGWILYRLSRLIPEWRRTRRRPTPQTLRPLLTAAVLSAAYFIALAAFPRFKMVLVFTDIPVATGIVVLLVCAVILYLARTKIGSDFLAVGQNRHIAESAGINVNRTRIVAIVCSTVLASLGQLVYLQNIGTFTTYSAHEQVGTFSIAALLVGGASIKKANIGHAILGALLFHTMFVVSPIAGKNLFNDAQYGEFFRVFVSYAVIAIALALHAWKTGFMIHRKRKAKEG